MGKAVSKKMLINVKHPEEARVAIVHDGRLMELNIEISGKEQTKGNIYKGVVLRVEPGLQAAFVDIGRPKPGFLQMGELHPDLWQWRDDVPEDQRKRRPRIQEVLRRGQELVVQVEKDERDNKGSALTSYLSLPGRYMVIMPGSDSTGISRKVEQESVRKQLKEIMAGMSIPEGIGYIVRTQAVGRTPEELRKDMESLLAQYEEIRKSAAEIRGAGEIYRDRGLIIRFIRDYFSDDIDEVVVDSKEAYNEAKEFFRETMPECEKRVKLHREKRPIFSRFQIEEQIDQIYEKRVPLPSGGSLVIDPTEALVSIDVNSGKSSGERGIEDTAFKTNMEAAEEVARQLRLRDLGGLIVIDFIDMRDRKHNHEVERTLKQALKMDKARVNLGRISDFGLLEMSRQRIAKTLNDAIHLECPHCEGRGKIKSVEAMALSFLRKIHGAAAKGNVAEVRGGLPLEVAYYLLNRKKRELSQIESDYGIEVTVKGKTSFLMNQLELEVVKREKPHPEEIARGEADNDEAPPPATPVETAAEAMEERERSAEGAAAEGGKKRKRRRKKKKGAGEPAALSDQPEETPQDEQPPEEGGQPAELESAEPREEPVDATEGDAAPKKRRRRRSRKTGRTTEEGVVATEESAAELEAGTVHADEPAPQEFPATEVAGEEPSGETPPPEAVAVETAEAEAMEAVAGGEAPGEGTAETVPVAEPVPEAAAEEEPPPGEPPAETAAEAAAGDVAGEEEPPLPEAEPPEEASLPPVPAGEAPAEEMPAEAKPKRPRKPRARKKPEQAPDQPAETPPETEAQPPAEEQTPPPAKPRRRRKSSPETTPGGESPETAPEPATPPPRRRARKKDVDNQ